MIVLADGVRRKIYGMENIHNKGVLPSRPASRKYEPRWRAYLGSFIRFMIRSSVQSMALPHTRTASYTIPWLQMQLSYRRQSHYA